MAQVVVALAVLLILMRVVCFFSQMELVVAGLMDIQLAVEVLDRLPVYVALRELQMLLLEVDQVVVGVVPTILEAPLLKAATVVYLAVAVVVVVLGVLDLPLAALAVLVV
jgi:hypothetical protein